MKTKLHIVIIVTLSLVWLILSAGSDVALSAWQPPIGIPRPEFGIEETHWMYEGETYDFGYGPEPYKDAGNGPYTHYIDNTHPNATDTDNPYGTSSVPRRTIPWGIPPISIAAGSVVEIHGGPYTATAWGKIYIQGDGTSALPIFIRGPSSGPAPRMESHVTLGRYGSSNYVIVENLDIMDFYSGNGTHHIVLRNSKVQNSDTNGIVIGGDTSGSYDIVVYNNKIYDHGDWQSTVEDDKHGVSISYRGYNIWIIDNEISYNGGDSVQVNGGFHHVYIGRNTMHHNGEEAIDLKVITDVIISQNEMYAFGYDYGPRTGACVVTHANYGIPPVRTWFLYNTCHSSTGGISIIETTDAYLIGNVIYDISWGGIRIRDSKTAYVINNDIYDAGSGISIGTCDAVHLFNNIVSNANTHILYQVAATADASNIQNNLLYQSGNPIVINWAGTTYTNLTDFQSATGKGAGSIEADPLFVDPANNNFSLLSGSPAIDKGTLSDVYQTFFDLYGIDIRKDIEGGVRPHGEQWDIGAYEYGASSPSPNQPPIADAGLDQTITDKDKDGSEQVTLDGSASRDPDGTIVSFIWSEGGLEIATGKNPTVTLSTGTHSITLTVADDGGSTDNDTVTIKVLEGDKGFGELPAGCYNNVFNPAKGERSLIVVELPKQAHVRLNLYNTRGKRIRELADEQKEAGTHKYYWDGKSGNGDVVGSGLYFVHIQAGDYKKTKKIVVVK